MEMRWDIINYLIDKCKYKFYLELGYYRGWCFDNVKCMHKVAVDPNPCKNEEQLQLESGSHITMMEYNNDDFVIGWEKILKATSDDFFKEKDRYTNFKKDYDLIFIDGLHEANQVYRDITNSLEYLRQGGIILLHDMNPPTYKHTTTGVDGNWNGDCYKALLRFIRENGDRVWDINTIDTDWGIGIIRKHVPETDETVPFNNDLDYQKAINDWEYFDKNRERLLNLITVEQFKELY